VLGGDGREAHEVHDAGGGISLSPLTPGLPLRIEMDLLFDPDRRPSGSVWVGASDPHQVLGWLELMSELTRLLTDHVIDPSDPGGAGDAVS
jgi:uncharacterized protein YhdP